MRLLALTGIAFTATVLATATVSPARGVAGPCNASAPTRIAQPTPAQLAAAGLNELPLGPRAKRVDLVAPRFSRPTSVTNPLFPISNLHSVVLNGKVNGKAFRTETTLLPDTRIVEWAKGQCVKTLVSQYTAYLDGRIEEVALDLYAQADDGSVWYFGEDVYNYRNGVIADTSGTWLAGKEGPAAMIMPGSPRLGDVHRPENIPGLVFEEVAVRSIDATVRGPRGKVRGALVGRELHDDGSFSDKVFAPGYGEFSSAHDGDLEALAVAVPVDRASGSTPGELSRLLRGAYSVFDAAPAGRWQDASATAARMAADWSALRARGVPRRLVAPTNAALTSLTAAVKARAARRAEHAALDVAQATLDLQLRYRAPAQIDRARLDLWARQVRVDVGARSLAALSGDVAAMEWIRDRIARSLSDVALTRVDTILEELRANVGDGALATAAKTAARLRKVLQASAAA